MRQSKQPWPMFIALVVFAAILIWLHFAQPKHKPVTAAPTSTQNLEQAEVVNGNRIPNATPIQRRKHTAVNVQSSSVTPKAEQWDKQKAIEDSKRAAQAEVLRMDEKLRREKEQNDKDLQALIDRDKARLKAKKQNESKSVSQRKYF